MTPEFVRDLLLGIVAPDSNPSIIDGVCIEDGNLVLYLRSQEVYGKIERCVIPTKSIEISDDISATPSGLRINGGPYRHTDEHGVICRSPLANGRCIACGWQVGDDEPTILPVACHVDSNGNTCSGELNEGDCMDCGWTDDDSDVRYPSGFYSTDP